MWVHVYICSLSKCVTYMHRFLQNFGGERDMAVQNWGEIPEDCIATVLSLTTPKEACRLSAVAATFRSASLSDAVWDRFLPSDLISRAVGGGDSLLAKFHSKKDLYLRLCNHPILIDGGRMSLSLEKWSGKKCYIIGARELDIVWGDTPECWRWMSHPDSRFGEVAELVDVCWFQIRGKIKMSMLSADTNYAAYLVFTYNASLYGFEDQGVDGYVGLGGDGKKRVVSLDRERARHERHLAWVNKVPEEYAQQRNDGWMEVELGECFVQEQGGELEASAMEVDGGTWKSGLVIQGIEIRPKHPR